MKIQFPATIDKVVHNRRRRPLLYLIFGLLFLLLFCGLVYYYPPTAELTFIGYSIPLIPLFIVILSGSLFCLGTFAFKNKAHGVLIASFVVIYLLFRLNNLTHPFFFILLFALFLSLELFVSYRK